MKVVVTGVPGAMGDREDSGFQLPLGLLALRTGCPVKLVATREESFLGHAHRHPALLRYRHHADAEGRLVKVEAQILLDAGAYADASSDALAAAVAFAAGPYVVPHVFVEGWAVRTNNPPSGHVRGEGAMQVCAAYEGQMDKLAAQLGLEPAELRMRNVMATGDLLPTGQTVTCPAPVGELLKAVRDADLPPLPVRRRRDDLAAARRPGGRGRARRGAARGRLRAGHGAHARCRGHDEVSTATVKVQDGSATVICAAVETGQGFTTLARQIVQEVLGVEEVHVLPADTDQPPAGPAARGRHTWVSGGAVERAAQDGPHPAAAAAGRQVRDVHRAARHRRRQDHLVRRCARAPRSPRRWTARSCGPPHSAARTPPSRWTRPARATPSSGLAFCAVRAVVDVDIELGTVRVVEMAVAQDVGRVLNPAPGRPPASRRASPRASAWRSWRTCGPRAAWSSARR